MKNQIKAYIVTNTRSWKLLSVLNSTLNGGKSKALQPNCVEFKSGLKLLVSNLTIIKVQVLEKK